MSDYTVFIDYGENQVTLWRWDNSIPNGGERVAVTKTIQEMEDLYDLTNVEYKKVKAMEFDYTPKPIQIIKNPDFTYTIKEKGVPGKLGTANTYQECLQAIRNGIITFRNGTTVKEEDIE